MRQFGHSLGILLLILAAAAGVAQLLTIWVAGAYRPLSLGSVWYAIHANSLVGFQALIEKSVGSLVWMPIQFLLGLPAFLVLGVPGIVLFFGCRPRHRGFV